MSGYEERSTRYVGAEFVSDWQQAEQRGMPLRLTTDDVAKATGVEVAAGMTIEYEITGTAGRVRVFGLDGFPSEWADVKLRDS
jgi:hypothetical protein